MGQRSDVFELGRLGLHSGEARRVDLEVAIEPLQFGGQTYAARPSATAVTVDAARTTGEGYSLRLRYRTELSGACARCLEDAGGWIEVDTREVDQPGAGEELSSPYIKDDQLDLGAWARDALALALPEQIVCSEDCLGLCDICGENLNDAGDEHDHERPPDPRWAKLAEIRFE